nr:hypothetical protein Iba_chr12bCG18210 [Ipomoea batatas]
MSKPRISRELIEYLKSYVNNHKLGERLRQDSFTTTQSAHYEQQRDRNASLDINMPSGRISDGCTTINSVVDWFSAEAVPSCEKPRFCLAGFEDEVRGRGLWWNGAVRLRCLFASATGGSDSPGGWELRSRERVEMVVDMESGKTSCGGKEAGKEEVA